MAAKKAMVHRRRFLKIYSLKFCDIWQNFDFYRILNDENFKMEVEQKNFVIHLIITTQLYYWSSQSPSVKLWSNKIQMVMISYSQLCASLYENLTSEFYVNWAKVKCIQSFMLPWKQRNRHILPVDQNLLSVYFSLANFQLVSCNLSLAMIWQMTYTHKLPKLCSTTLKVNLRCLRLIELIPSRLIRQMLANFFGVEF